MHVWDHGEPAVDQFWRRLLERPEYRRHASLGGAIPSDVAHYVPPEFAAAGRIPESYFICQDIWNAS
jgi:hypothetical protein